MPDYAYIVFSGFTAFCNIVPTAYHLIHGNSGPASFGIWGILLNLTDFVNGLLWQYDAKNRAPVLCDISSKINFVAPMGLIAANLCIIRFIARIVGPSQRIEDRRSKRRRAFTDYALAFGLPLSAAAASFIYQTARFGISKTIGCTTVAALSWPTYLFYLIWPPILCGVICGYAVVVVYHLSVHRRNLRDLIAKSRTPLNMARFLRLGGFAATYFCISLPFTIVGTLNTIASTAPYIPFRWSDLHNEDNSFSRVRLNPFLDKTDAADWSGIVSALTFFIFFGFAGEILELYARFGRAIHLDRVIPLLRQKEASAPAQATLGAPAVINLKATQWDSSTVNSKSKGASSDVDSIELPFQTGLPSGPPTEIV